MTFFLADHGAISAAPKIEYRAPCMYTMNDIPSLWEMIKHYDSVSPFWNKASLLHIGLGPVFSVMALIWCARRRTRIWDAEYPLLELLLLTLGLTSVLRCIDTSHTLACQYYDMIWEMYGAAYSVRDE